MNAIEHYRHIIAQWEQNKGDINYIQGEGWGQENLYIDEDV